MITTKELIRSLKQNESKIIKSIREDEIEVYLFLKRRFKESDVIKDKVFQYLFRKFFVMDRWTSEEYNKQFFLKMQKNKGIANPESLEQWIKTVILQILDS